MASMKPINMDSDTFAAMKKDMTTSLNRLLNLMQKYGAEKAALAVKLTVSLEEQDMDDGSKGIVPTFEHKVTSTVQRKDELAGELGGEYVLTVDDHGGHLLKPIGQMDMFEDAV